MGMDDDFLVEGEGIGSARFEFADVFVALFMLISGVFAAFTNTFDNLMKVAMMHSNWKVQQREFQTEAAREIESLPTTEA